MTTTLKYTRNINDKIKLETFINTVLENVNNNEKIKTRSIDYLMRTTDNQYNNLLISLNNIDDKTNFKWIPDLIKQPKFEVIDNIDYIIGFKIIPIVPNTSPNYSLPSLSDLNDIPYNPYNTYNTYNRNERNDDTKSIMTTKTGLTTKTDMTDITMITNRIFDTHEKYNVQTNKLNKELRNQDKEIHRLTYERDFTKQKYENLKSSYKNLDNENLNLKFEINNLKQQLVNSWAANTPKTESQSSIFW